MSFSGEKIEKAKIDKASIEGRMKQIGKTIKDKFKVPSAKEARAKLKDMQKEIQKLKQKIEEGKEELSEAYDW